MIDKSEIQHNIKVGADTDVLFARINTDRNSSKFGKIKTSEGIYKFPYLSRTTGNSLKPTTETIQSNELRKGGAESAPRIGNTSVDGSLDIEVSPTTFDDNLAATFKNEWKKWESDTNSAINFDNQHCAPGFFLTRANLEDETVYNDDENLKPRRLLDLGTPETVGGLLKVPAGSVVHELTFGKKNIEYDVIKRYGGVEGEDMYHAFDRLAIGTLDFNAQIGSIITGSFGFVGDKSSDILSEGEMRAYLGGEDSDRFEDGTTTGNSFVDNIPNQSTDTDQFTAREGDLWINGKNITFATSLTLNIDKQLDKKYALFVKNAIGKTSQKTAITSNLETYLVPESKELYNFANNNETFEILFAFEDKEINPEFIYLFQIFSAKAEDKDLTASGADDYSMSIPLRSFGERLMRVFRIALPKTRDVEFTPASGQGAVWTDAGTLTIRPNVEVSVIPDDLSILDVLKNDNGEVVSGQRISSGFNVTDDGMITVTESAFDTVTGGTIREIEVTMNGVTKIMSFGETESDAPDPVSDIAITVKAKKATITWVDPSDTDFDHVIVDVQDNAGKSVLSETVVKGVQTYTATGLTTGSEYNVDVIAVDKNGNKSTYTTKTFQTSSINLGGVDTLAVAKESDDYKVTWGDPVTALDGVRISVYDGDTLLESDDVLKATKTYTITSTLTVGTKYTIKAVPYKAFNDAYLLGTEDSVEYTAE